MEPNLPNNCYACNRTCINSKAGCLPFEWHGYGDTSSIYIRPSILSFSLFTTPITPCRIRCFLFYHIIPPLSSYKQSLYHSSMANYETRANAQRVLRSYNWVTLLYTLDAISTNSSFGFCLINVVKIGDSWAGCIDHIISKRRIVINCENSNKLQ